MLESAIPLLENCYMQRARGAPAFARSMLLLMAAAACSDLPSSPGAPAPGETAPSFSAAARAPRDVPAVHIDLPASPRPWDQDPAALESAMVTASGYAVVAFKETGSGRALATGHRGAVTAGTIRAGRVFYGCAWPEVVARHQGTGQQFDVAPLTTSQHPVTVWTDTRRSAQSRVRSGL